MKTETNIQAGNKQTGIGQTERKRETAKIQRLKFKQSNKHADGQRGRNSHR